MADVLSLEEFVHVLANPESFALKEMVWYAINASTELVDEHANYTLQSRLGTYSCNPFPSVVVFSWSTGY